jgi:alginate O-acetyltransferase complex protein AlgI
VRRRPLLVFGFLHGTYLIGETFLQRTRLRRMQLWGGPLGKLFLWAVTIALCLIAFVFYRATSIEQSLRMLSAMSSIPRVSHAFRLSDADLLIAAVVMEFLFIAHWLCHNTSLEAVAVGVPWWTVSVSLALMLLAITLSSGESQRFLYFGY